jgi:hypothetical protein
VIFSNAKKLVPGVIVATLLACVAPQVFAYDQEQTSTPLAVIATSTGVISNGDLALDRAVDFLSTSRNAVETRKERSHYKSGFGDRIVRVHRHTSDKLMIMGGSEATPM